MRPVLIAAIVVACLGAGGLAFARLHAAGPEDLVVVTESPPPVRTPEPSILIDVAGAVAHPGVYRLAAGSRVIDALLAAGGMTGDADLMALNKAAPLRDGARIFVPRPGEPVPAGTLGSEAERKVDVNHASAAELEGLPGIGPATAARIVRSRDARPFVRIDELQTRGLVTPRVFADIRDQLTTR